MSGGRDDAARPASAAKITAILGAIDETMLADIHRTGASAAEVLEAFTRFEGNDAIGPVARRAANAMVVEVMAILQAADTGPEQD